MSLEKLKPIPLLPRESFHRTAHWWRFAMRTRLLLDNAPPPPPNRNSKDFDTNMVVILAALLCALLCALSLNSIVRCALRCRGRGGEAAAAGLKRSALRQIPAEAYAGAEGAECAICLGDLHRDGERVRVLPVCRHVFHMRCIDTWLAGHSSCPTCRHSLVDKEGKERIEGLRREPPVIGSGFLL